MSGLIGKQLDHYRLVEQIGQGGMATVYRAEDGRSGDVVALKVLSPTISGDRRFVRRFRREGGLVRQLRHPHILPVSDYGEDEGLIYLAMPYIDGDTLHDHYLRGGATQVQAARWLSQVADALHFAHEQGVIHRDVKPSNVLINQDGLAMLGDFGLARWIEGSSTLTGSMLMGTPAYMSPEQARGEKLDARSDQYSLAVIMYQLFTGRLPFEGETPMQTAMKHLNEPVPQPRRFNEDLPPALERVILTSLAKDAAARFPSVRALNTAFQAALRGDPLTWLKPTQALDLPSGSRPQPAPAAEAEAGRSRLGWVLAALAGAVLFVLAGLFALQGGVEAMFPAPTEAPAGGPIVTEAPTVLPSAPAASATNAPTPVPPIASQQCPGLQIYGFTAQGNDAAWLIDNGTEGTMVLEDLLDFSAPASNQAVQTITLGEQVVFEGPAVEGQFTWVEGADRTIGSGEVERLAFTFAWQAAPSDYAMELLFGSGCRLEGAW